jgi:hypothetical protein
MGLAIEDEEVRRRPKVDPTKCKIVTHMFPDTLSMQPYIEAQMAWAQRTDPSKDGYDLLADGSKVFSNTRADQIAQTRAVLAALDAKK